ncbi:hypothetical protein K504DRAFT_281982 [Pleomassaria siparia CBS 279.74]|uniref:Uncharacterized protein n=1 Tax=Pleomassaria siparia CBS 279.74 TaxID=1314801 RepID=A0A6G1KBB9_9PLEO|nr:hypothetical protein K504DRAFT_281982 [Pleomassaria siparia CBS 279.74]
MLYIDLPIILSPTTKDVPTCQYWQYVPPHSAFPLVRDVCVCTDTDRGPPPPPPARPWAQQPKQGRAFLLAEAYIQYSASTPLHRLLSPPRRLVPDSV